MPTETMIDVSVFQGDIDWGAVAADGITGVWVRLCEGRQNRTMPPAPTPSPDPMRHEFIEGAKAAGVPWGVYFPPHLGWDTYPAYAEANLGHFTQYYREAVQRHGQPDLRTMLDLEVKSTTSSDYRAEQDAVVIQTGMRDVCGHEPTLYMTTNWATNVLNNGLLSGDLHVANYGSDTSGDKWQDTAPQDRAPQYERIVAWQYTRKGEVAGIAGGVDLNDIPDAAAVSVTAPSVSPSPVAPLRPIPPGGQPMNPLEMLINDDRNRLLCAAACTGGKVIYVMKAPPGTQERKDWDYWAAPAPIGRGLEEHAIAYGTSVSDGDIKLWAEEVPEERRFEGLFYL